MTRPKKLKKQYTLEEMYNPRIDLDREACLYGRQSTKDQVVNNVQSHISQTILLLDYAKELGFRDDGSTGRVTLFVENQVVDADGNVSIQNASGTWPIDRRPGLKTICDLIEHGTPDGKRVGVVIAEYVDRLFRDEDRIDSNVFIKICKENDCYVHISSKRMTYNLANDQHAEMLRLEIQMAAMYIKNHVKGTMLSRRSQKGKKGLWAGLGAIPMGYIVDKDEKSPSYGKFIVYEPHAEIVRWVFKRFIELGFSLSRFSQELKGCPCIFPDFEKGTFIGNRMNTRIEGGYLLGSKNGLRGLLTNEAYIGIFNREGNNIPNNHEPIMDEETFWLVYDHIEDKRPDGTPTGKNPTKTYLRKDPSEIRPPLLKKLLATSTGERSYYFASGKAYYYQLAKKGSLQKESICCIEADLLERLVVDKLFMKIEENNVVDLVEARKQQYQKREKRVKDLDRQINEIEGSKNTLLKRLAKTKTEAVAEEIEAEIQRILERKPEIEAEKAIVLRSLQEEPLGSLEEELKGLRALWHLKSFDLKKNLMELVIKTILVDAMSPRFYRLCIEWAHKDWGVDECYLDRGNSAKPWAQKEDNLLRELFPNTENTRENILKALPNRNWRSIVNRAHLKFHLHRGQRDTKRNLPPIDFSYNDLVFLEQKGFTMEMFADCNQDSWS